MKPGRTFRFAPPAPVETRVSQTTLKADGTITKLVAKRAELAEFVQQDPYIKLALKRALLDWVDANQHIEATLTQDEYDRVLEQLAKETTIPKTLQALVNDVRMLQEQAEAELKPRQRFAALDPSSESGASAPGTVRQKKTKTPAARKTQPKRLFESEEEPQVEPMPEPVPASPPPKRPTVVVDVTPEPPVAVPAAPRPNGKLLKMARDINDLLEQALQPMVTALSAVAWKLGYMDARSLMLYDPKLNAAKDKTLPSQRLRVVSEDPRHPALQSLEEFKRVYEPMLGTTFLRAFMVQAAEAPGLMELRKLERLAKTNPPRGKEKTGVFTLMEPVGSDACFDFQRDTTGPGRPEYDAKALELAESLAQRYPNDQSIRDALDRLRAGRDALDLMGLTDPQKRFAPAWAFEVVSSAVFRAFVQPAGLAAFDMAHAHVRRIPGCGTFTLRELICSTGVLDQFAFLVAHQFLDASKGLPPLKGEGRGRDRSAYVNINQMREMLLRRHYLCTIWFESVRAVSSTLPAEFERYRAQVREQKFPGVALPDPAVLAPPADDAGRYEWERRWDRAQWETRMDEYARQLPRRELKHYE